MILIGRDGSQSVVVAILAAHLPSMYLRFVITRVDDDSHRPQRQFIAAEELLDSDTLSAEERSQLQQILHWFNENLPVPGYRFASRRIFWFKGTAIDCIKRMWDLTHILRYHGYLVVVEKRRQLGNIVYEDKFQVAAYPSRHDQK